MNQKTSKVVMMESDEAASIKTITGWVDRHGRFWGDNEHQARWSGSTHRQCRNHPENHPAYPSNGFCELCQKASRQAKFAQMTRVVWAGEPLVIFDTDIYFFDTDSLVDYCRDNAVLPGELQLVICQPNHVPQIDIEQHCEEIMPEDGDISRIPQNILDAVEALNKAIKEAKEVSWSQGTQVAIIPDDLLDEEQTASVLSDQSA